MGSFRNLPPPRHESQSSIEIEADSAVGCDDSLQRMVKECRTCAPLPAIPSHPLIPLLGRSEPCPKSEQPFTDLQLLVVIGLSIIRVDNSCPIDSDLVKVGGIILTFGDGGGEGANYCPQIPVGEMVLLVMEHKYGTP